MQKPVPKEETLRRYKIWCECNGRTGQAATEAGITESTMRRSVREARKLLGEPEVPDGFKLKGKSTLYDAQTGEPKIEWVKTTEDRERQQEIFAEAMASVAKNLPKIAIKPPPISDTSLMACYPVGDHHFGSHAWGEEAGVDYDLKIAEKILIGATDYLVETTPACDEAAVVFMGDLFHYDGDAPITPANKNLLDADSRFGKMVQVGLRAVLYLVRAAAAKHSKVRVVVLPGNHDPYGSIFLMEALRNIFENETRIEVDTSPADFHYFRHGKCLVGMYHGHKVKMDKLPMIMAADRPEDWGETEYRYWWTGHIHHDSMKDFVGCRVESLRVLAGPDAWTAQMGYRQKREMKAIILHRDFGEVARHIVNPEMLE